MSEMTLEVHPREARGSRASRRMRRGGRIPAVVYGGGKDTVPIEIDRKSLLDLLKITGGENAVFLLKLAGSGKERHTMIREIDLDPVNREVRHIDFQRVLMTEKVRVQVAIELHGTPLGVKNESGVLDFVHREVEVECLPGDIPRHLTLDVSPLHIGQHLEASALELPEGVVLIDEPTRVLVSSAQPRLAVEEEEEGAEELLEAEREEPEVIRRGRTEDGDEEDEG
jgi:large subunit ribosomal protein L25